MVVIDGELWMSARESANAVGYTVELPRLQARGARASKLGRLAGLRPLYVTAPCTVPWPRENSWPERIWLASYWELFNENGVV